MSTLRGVVVVLVGVLGIASCSSALPRFRRTALSRRLTPYLGALGPRRSNLLGRQPVDGGWTAVFVPLFASAGAVLHRVFDDDQELPDRLRAAGSGLDASGFRAAQVGWGVGGLIAGLTFAVLLAAAGRPVSLTTMVVTAIAFAATGVAARDRALSRAIARRRELVRGGLPTAVDLVCLAVTAGEGLRGALGMVADGGGPLALEIRGALRDARTGTPLTEALEVRARRLGVPALDQFVGALVAAQERGMPVADALRSLAFDLREQDKRELIEMAGKKQISMLVPVVALILPVA
ncbi:MAG: type II secretion system F family protein, partial [Acidimicrobiia bacterium]